MSITAGSWRRMSFRCGSIGQDRGSKNLRPGRAAPCRRFRAGDGCRVRLSWQVRWQGLAQSTGEAARIRGPAARVLAARPGARMNARPAIAGEGLVWLAGLMDQSEPPDAHVSQPSRRKLVANRWVDRSEVCSALIGSDLGAQWRSSQQAGITGRPVRSGGGDTDLRPGRSRARGRTGARKG